RARGPDRGRSVARRRDPRPRARRECVRAAWRRSMRSRRYVRDRRRGAVVRRRGARRHRARTRTARRRRRPRVARPTAPRRQAAPRPPALGKATKTSEGGAPEPPPVAFRKRGANRWRFVRAYTTTFQVIFSYLTLFWSAKLFGRAYRDQNIKAVHQANAKRV